MKELVEDYLFKSGAQRDPEKNHRFFKYATNKNHLAWLVFCQCLTQFEGKPGKRKGRFILRRFLEFSSDYYIPSELRDIFHSLFDVTREDRRLVSHAVDQYPLEFSTKVEWYGFVEALKMAVTGETKPPAQLFQKQKETIKSVVGTRFDDFNETTNYQIISSMPGRTISSLKQELTEYTFNPDYMGIW